MKKVIRQTKKAIKILTEFNLKKGEKLRIYVYFWGDKEYARKLGFYGNTIYKPVLIDKNGFRKDIYKRNKGLHACMHYDDWNERLARRTDAKRLKEVADALYELAKISTSFDKRQAHVVYQLLRITRGGPTFRISKPSDAEDLNVRIACMHACIRKYDGQIERIVEELRQDLANLARPRGPMINLDILADYVNEKMAKIFEKESR